MPDFEYTFRSSAEGVLALGTRAADVAALDDTSLLAAQNRVGALRRHTDTVAAWIAAEIAHRSRYELGYAGLAQQKGFLSPEALIQSVTNVSRTEAAKLVAVGTMMAETEAETVLVGADAGALGSADPMADGMPDAGLASGLDAPGFGSGGTDCDGNPRRPGPSLYWQTPIGAAVTDGALSLEGADIIRKVLATIETVVAPEALRDAASTLITDAAALNADQLYRRARQLRDRVDADGIRDREAERHDARYLKTWQQADGMYRGSWLLDPENGRLVAAAFENILSPRRGGPRFVADADSSDTDRAEKARADALVNDERSNGQIAADALVDLVRLAVDADPGTLFGSRRPAVRIIVTQDSLRQRSGSGAIEGTVDPVSMETIERHLCNTGGIPIGFDDDGQCLNVGRNQRLFTEKQRIGLAVRDGGCMITGCERPPSMCEVNLPGFHGQLCS